MEEDWEIMYRCYYLGGPDLSYKFYDESVCNGLSRSKSPWNDIDNWLCLNLIQRI